jgi:surfactin synthase thioesterase subunit
MLHSTTSTLETTPVIGPPSYLWQSRGASTGPDGLCSAVLRMSGPLNESAIEAAVNDLSARHEVLHTVLRSSGGILYRHPAADPLPVLETRTATGETLDAAMLADLREPFDLASAPPLRGSLYRLGPEMHTVHLVFHPVAADEESLEIAVADLAHAYNARIAGTAPRWDLPAAGYSQFAASQYEQLGSDQHSDSRLSRHMTYWRRALADVPARMNLPANPDRACRAFLPLRLTDEQVSRVQDLAFVNRVTPSMVLHAAVAALLQEVQSGRDLPICTAVRGRPSGELAQVMGPFENMVVLRIAATEPVSFRELLDMVRLFSIYGLSQSNLPFHHIQGLFGGPQVLVRSRNLSRREIEFSGLATSVTIRPAYERASDLIFNFAAHRSDDGGIHAIDGSLGYWPGAFSKHRAQRMLHLLSYLLDWFSADHERLIGNLVNGTDSHEDLAPKQPIEAPAPAPPAARPRQATPGGREWKLNPLLLPDLGGVPNRYTPPRDPLQLQLTRIWEDLLGLMPIGITEPFPELCPDPAVLRQMLAEVERVCAVTPPRLADADLTVEALARAMLDQLPRSPVICIQQGSSAKPPFIYIHGDFIAGGFYTWAMAKAIGSDQTVYAVQPHGLTGRPIPLSIEEMAADHIQDIRQLQPSGPYYLAGHCNGGLIAYEVARQLKNAGEAVHLVALVHTVFMGRECNVRMQPQPDAERMKLPQVRNAWLWTRYWAPIVRYRPQPYDGLVTLLWPRAEPFQSGDPVAAWKESAGEVDFRVVEGDHLTCITIHVNSLGAELARSLRLAQASECEIAASSAAAD